MINDHIQRQEAGENSTNYQAKEMTIVQGISYLDAKEIALDVYQKNFIKLSEHATQVALTRAEEFVDDFLGKLQSKNPSLLEGMNQPSIQNSLYSAQKQYAVTGDKELKGLLLDLVVQRCEKEDRSIHQIVLDEAIELASKLTVEQMDVLTINFIISRAQSNQIVNVDTLLAHIDRDILPFISTLEIETSCYEHLTYLGAATVEYTGDVPQMYVGYAKKYNGVFSKGIKLEDFEAVFADDEKARKLMMPCLQYPNLYQVAVLNEKQLDDACTHHGITEEIKIKLSSLMNNSTMPPLEIKEWLLEKRPKINKLFDVWEKTRLHQMFLTTVGIALAQANFQRRTGVELPIDIWVK
jgi:hypothetical protein